MSNWDFDKDNVLILSYDSLFNLPPIIVAYQLNYDGDSITITDELNNSECFGISKYHKNEIKLDITDNLTLNVLKRE